MTAPDWSGALCRQVGDPELWFPNAGHGETAKAICQRCPLVAECLAYAAQDPTLTGVWGATSASERNAIRRRRRLVVAS